MSDYIKWKRDQLKAAIREHPHATTAEICKATCSTCRAGNHYHCYSRVYSNLRLMARAGEIVWEGWNEPPHPTVTTWSLPPSEADDLAELEAMWAVES